MLYVSPNAWHEKEVKKNEEEKKQKEDVKDVVCSQTLVTSKR